MEVIWETKCQGIGPLFEQMASEGMFVTFGENAPKELTDFCAIINIEKVREPIEKGMFLLVGDIAFPITAVGDAAMENLSSMGHATFSFDGEGSPSMAGTIHLEGEVPTVSADTMLSIVKP